MGHFRNHYFPNKMINLRETASQRGLTRFFSNRENSAFPRTKFPNRDCGPEAEDISIQKFRL